jgi:hypothetical protein
VSSGHRPQREKLKFAFIKLVKLDLRVAFVNPVPNSKFQIPTFSLILPSLYIQILDTYPKLKKRIMSFQDFQSGGIGKPSSSSAGPRSQSQSPSQAVAAGIFQINTAVAAFRRLVDSIGTAKDTPVHRQKLSVLSFFLSFPFFSIHFSHSSFQISQAHHEAANTAISQRHFR